MNMNHKIFVPIINILFVILVATPISAIARNYQEEGYEQYMYDNMSSPSDDRMNLMVLMIIIGIVGYAVYLFIDEYPNFFVNLFGGILIAAVIYKAIQWILAL